MNSHKQKQKPNILNVNVHSPTMLSSTDTKLESKTRDGKLNEFAALFIGKLNTLENNLIERFDALSADIGNIRLDVTKALDRITIVEQSATAINKRIDDLQLKVEAFETGSECNLSERSSLDTKNKIDELQKKVSDFENNSIACDVILHNVPNSINVDDVLNKILVKLDCNAIRVCDVFRLRPRSSSGNCFPIIGKLHSGRDRVNLLKALGTFRKNNKRPLCLNDIGLDGDSNIYIHECLTDFNRKLLKTALQLKSQNFLTSVYSMRGRVFVRMDVSQDAILVACQSDLERIAGVHADQNA